MFFGGLKQGKMDNQNERIAVLDDSKIIVDLYALLTVLSEEYSKAEIQDIQFDLFRIKDKRYFVKKAYDLISERKNTGPSTTQTRIFLIQWLEATLRIQFKNTRDMKHKIEKYLGNYQVRKKPVAERIKKARKKRKWTQKELADHLGYKSHVTIAQFEKGLRYPPERIFQWLEAEGM